jgi:anthranilate phosphoribosyltransferase
MSSTTTWSQILETLTNGLDLDSLGAKWAMNEILQGNAEVPEIKDFLLALKAKGEIAEEVNSFVSVMYQHSAPIQITERAVDTVGTGGDGANTINISTTAAIIAAAAGAKVVKHGNRAASSKSGSADLLEALGINIDLDGDGVEAVFAEIGIGFCFAPKFHPAMRFAAPARKELGVPTIFNILGPLANPAKPKAAAIGVANDRMHLLMAEVLAAKGVDGFVFRGDDGLDEITLATTTSVLTIGQAEISSDLIDPTDFAIARAPIAELVGGDAQFNANVARAIFNGEHGAPRDAVALNAAAAIAAYKGDMSKSLQERMQDGYRDAISAIDSGAATQLLTKWIAVSQRLVSKN